ncbi:MAG: redoxin family protein [Gammaproteobacteria bacterium]|nr:redoxin family protein [Gammaproteobacteria bacterium]
MRIINTLFAILLSATTSRLSAVETFAAGHAPALDPHPDVWINSAPLDWPALEGKVVLLNVWTYGCGNCQRSLPWLSSVRAKYRLRGFEIVAVHSPEFPWERSRSAVAVAVEEHGIGWPVMLDNGLRYWTALGNRYWPAFYIVDRHGRIAGRFVGETHAYDGRAGSMERLIEKLLNEG